MFSITACVCARMSSVVTPNSSATAPANVLSGRRLLVPETKARSPITFTCGKRPRGVAFPATTVRASWSARSPGHSCTHTFVGSV